LKWTMNGHEVEVNRSAGGDDPGHDWLTVSVDGSPLLNLWPAKVTHSNYGNEVTPAIHVHYPAGHAEGPNIVSGSMVYGLPEARKISG
jgi:hypothetical protein